MSLRDRPRRGASGGRVRSVAAMRRLISLVVATVALLIPASVHAAVTLTSSTSALAVDYHGASYFVAGTGALRGLYRTDGTIPGTHRVVPVEGIEAYESGGNGLAVVDDRLVFTAYTSFFRTGFLMVSDGTAAGTRRLIKAQRGPSTPKTAAQRLSVGPPIVAGDQLYVNVDDGSRDMSATMSRVNLATGSLTTVLGQNRAADAVATGPGDDLYFFVPSGNGIDGGLWHVKGTQPAERLGPPSNRMSAFGALGDELYFSGTDSAHGTEPWITDGTPGGTHLVADLTPGAASSDITAFAATNTSMYVMGSGPSDVYGDHGPYLLTGPSAPAAVTFNGTRVDAGSAPTLAATTLAETDDAIWVVVGTYPNETRLRVPSGSSVADQPPGPVRDENGALIVPGTPFYISGDSLRSTDSAGMTTIIATAAKSPDAKSGPEPAIYSLSHVGSDVWFTAPSVDGGIPVLWRSDGTVGGTGPVAEPGQIDPVNSGLVVNVKSRRDTHAPYRYSLSGTLYFSQIIPSTAQKLCRGSIVITTSRYGAQRVLERNPELKLHWNGTACVYHGVLAPSRYALRVGRGRLSISVAFSGTAHVAAQHFSKRFAIRYG
jgi:ELWxxDGT repeat protein